MRAEPSSRSESRREAAQTCIGSTRETVSLTLSQFKRKKLIATEGRKVIISDSEALRALY